MTTALQAVASPLQVTEKVQLDLPAEQVWQLIGDFSRVHDWHPVVARTQITAGTRNLPGAVRKLTFHDGGTLDERLTRYEPGKMRLTYVIESGAFPVSDYSTTISVEPAPDTGKSWVTWHGEFQRADLSPKPAAGKDDKAAIDAVTGVYASGFRALETLVAERKSIERVISYYVEGGTEGDPQKVAKAFHPSATMKFVKDGRLVDEPIEAFYTNYIKSGARLQRSVETDYIDIRGTAAAAKLTIDYPTHQFIDYFNLLKIDGEWAVVSKIFHRVPKP